ncbi:CerR family C-terminal domain-containing protein [Desulfobaculum senezii]|jgi:AcrR family transcriptional regulator
MTASGKAQQRTTPRGVATRLRLIEEGGKLFAAKGFDGVSTRDIARACGVNLASIAYHFGGKKGLYNAVLEDIFANMQRASQPLVAAAMSGAREADGDARRLAQVAWRFVHGFLEFSLGNHKNYWAVDFLQREVMNGSDTLERFYHTVIGPVYEAGSELCHAASGGQLSAQERVLRGHALVGMCMSFVRGQCILLHRAQWDAFTPERVSAIAGTVAEAALNMLGLPAVEHAGNEGA